MRGRLPNSARKPSDCRKWAIALAVLPSLAISLAGARAEEPAAPRRNELMRLVRQDCGSCHGMKLTGGLGPALTPEALRDKPFEGLVATVVGGRPGTPMPPWRQFMNEPEAEWIVRQLMMGFPQ